MSSVRGWSVRRVAYGVATLVLVAGIVFLILAFAREHRDLQRLYMLAIGYLATGAAAITALAVAMGPRGRRILVILGITAGGAALTGTAALVWHVTTRPAPVELDRVDDAPAGVPVPERVEDAPEREAR